MNPFVPFFLYDSPTAENGLQVGTTSSSEGKAVLLIVASPDSLDTLSTDIAAADLDKVVTALYKAVGRDVLIVDRIPEQTPDPPRRLWTAGGSVVAAARGEAHLLWGGREMSMPADDAEQAGIALILAARAVRRMPSDNEVRALARTLAGLDKDWDTGDEPGARHVVQAHGILTDFTLTARDDA